MRGGPGRCPGPAPGHPTPRPASPCIVLSVLLLSCRKTSMPRPSLQSPALLQNGGWAGRATLGGQGTGFAPSSGKKQQTGLGVQERRRSRGAHGRGCRRVSKATGHGTCWRRQGVCPGGVLGRALCGGRGISGHHNRHPQHWLSAPEAHMRRSASERQCDPQSRGAAPDLLTAS